MWGEKLKLLTYSHSRISLFDYVQLQASFPVHSMTLYIFKVIISRKLNNMRIPDNLNGCAPSVGPIPVPGPGTNGGGTGSPGLITRMA